MSKDRILGSTATATAGKVAKLEGQKVSLNLPRRAYLRLAGSDFELNVAKPTGRLPSTLNEWQRKQVVRALKLNELIMGDKAVIEPPRHAEALNAFLATLNTPGIQQSVIEQMVIGLVNIPDGDPRLGNHSRFEVLDVLFETEVKGSARKPVLEHLARAKEFVPGPEKVQDEPAALPQGGGGSSAPSAANKLAESPDAADLDSI